MGFEKATEIQKKTIPKLLGSENDLIGLAQTGTGKTAAFGLPIVQNTSYSKSSVQTLILCPTRELTIQLNNDFNKFTKYKKKIRSTAIYGGVSISNQIKVLKKGVQIVCGTPGRILDLLKRRKLDLSGLKYLVLDEADEMLNMGFKEELERILKFAPKKRQTLMFSATMPSKNENIAAKFMKNPDLITIGKRNSGAVNVSHEYYVVREKDRYKGLKRIVDLHPDIYGLVFCRTRRETKNIAAKLMKDGYDVDSIHGNLSQNQRQYVMKKFKDNNIKILVATDVAARGIDVENLSHVINYRLPDDLEVYIHRTGRTGRAHKEGSAISLLNSREARKVNALERISKKSFIKKEIPKGKDICRTQLFKLISNLKKVEINENQISSFLPLIQESLKDMSRDELIKKIVSMEFNRFLNYYKNTPDLNYKQKSSKNRKKIRTETPGNHTRFYMNVGKSDKLRIKDICQMIEEKVGIAGINIGKIDMLKKISFFEMDKKYLKDLIGSFKFGKFKVRIEKAKPRKS